MMKRELLTLLLAFVAIFSVSAQSGNSRNSAYPFDWDGVHYQRGAGEAAVVKWYNVDLTNVLKQSDPTLALYVTNLSNEQSAHIEAAVYAGSSNTALGTYNFDLEPGQFRIMSRNVAMLHDMTYASAYIMLQVSETTDTVSLSAKAVETRRIETTCQQSTQLYVGDAEHAESSSALKWYNFLLDGYKSGYDININIRNTSASSSTIKTEFSYDCPSTGTTDRSEVVAAGATTTINLPVAVLEAIYEPRAYFSVRATGSYAITIDTVRKVVEPKATIPSYVAYDWETADGMSLAAGENWYEVECDSLTDDLLVPLVVLSAPSDAGANITTELAYIRMVNGEQQFIKLADYDWSFARRRNSFYLDVNELMALYSTLKGGKVYYGITSDVDGVLFKFMLNSIVTNTDCENAGPMFNGGVVSVDINAEHDADFAAWYSLDVATWRNNNEGKNLVLSLGNNDDAPVTVSTMLATCVQQSINEKELQKVTLPAYGDQTYIIRRSYLDGLADNIKFYFRTNGWVTVTQATPTDVVAYDGAAVAEEDVINFDWQYGHNQTANEVWYRVNKDTLNSTTVSPTLYIVNNGTTTANIEIQYAFSVTGLTKLKTPVVITLPAGKDTSYIVSRGELDNFATDIYYMRVKSDATGQGIYMQMQISQDNQYADRFCNAALDFNWVSGNIHPADTTLWYQVNFDYPINQGKKSMVLHITNRNGSEAAHVNATLATKCPPTSPQTLSRTIGAGSTIVYKDTIDYGQYSAYAAGAVWIQLESDQEVKFWAELVTDTYNDTIRSCSETEELKFDTLYTIEKDNAWYLFKSMKGAAFEQYDSTWVPKVVIINPNNEEVTLNTIAVFHCPATDRPLKRSLTINANDSIVNSSVERDLIDGYLNSYDSILVCISGGENVQFYMTMINPNKGNDCYHAIPMSLCPDSNLQVGGEKWYRIDIDSIRGKRLDAQMINVSSKNQTINAAIFLSCQSDVLEQTTRVSGPHTSIEREIGELVSGMRYSEAFLRIICQDSLVFKLCVGDDLPRMTDSIHLCTDSTISLIKAEPNIWYHQEGGDSAWYYLDVAQLDTLMRNANYADARLHIKTDCESTTITAKHWWECETDEMPTTKGQTVTTPYERVITYETVHAVHEPSSYLLLKGDNCFDFMLEVETMQGSACYDNIEFDWNYCNTHPAGKTLWYHINVDTLLHNPDKDLGLYIENLEDSAVVIKVDSLRLDCGREWIKESRTRTLQASQIDSIFVDNTLLQDFNVGNEGIYLKVWANGQVRICPTLVDAKEGPIVYDTIYREICYMYDFIDPFFEDNPDSVDMHNHTKYEIEKDIMLSDTVGFRDGTFHGDSIRWYEIHVLKSAELQQPINKSVLSALELEAGKKFSQAKRDEIAQQLFDSISRMSYISQMDSAASLSVLGEYVKWEVGVWNDVSQKYVNFTTIPDEYTSPFANEENNSELGLRVTFYDKCGYVNVDTLVLTFTDNTFETRSEHIDTVCAGYSFTDPLTAVVYSINVDTAIVDTVEYVDVVNDIKTDSIVTYTFHVFTALLSELEVQNYPTMQAGRALEFSEAEVILRDNFAEDNTYHAEITSVEWKYSEAEQKAADEYVAPTTLSSTLTTAVWVAYKLTTSCGDELYDTIQVQTTAADTLMAIVQEHICYGDSLKSRNGDYHFANVATQTWNDTVYNVMNADVTDQRFDSIYVFTLTTLMPADSVNNYWDLCEGHVDTTFFNTHIAGLAPGTYTYTDTLHTAEGCDSIWGAVSIIVHPTQRTTDSVSLCKLEAFQWGYPELRTFSWPGKGDYYVTDTFAAVYGCDSIVTMKFHVEENDTAWMKRTICGGSYFNEYPFLTENYTTGGRYIKAVQTNNTCDSIYVLDLTVQPVVEETITEGLCVGERSQYTGISYGSPGVYSDTIFRRYAVTGCDSIRTVRSITVYPKYNIDSVAQICQGETYMFNGQALSVQGDYQEVRTTIHGCDSIITLHLKVNPVYEIPVSGVICDNGSYTWAGHKNNIVYSNLSAGEYVYYDSLQTIHGCDSVYVLTLKVNPTYHYTVNDTICRGESINLGQNGGLTPINISGSYDEMRRSSTGCDSVITHVVVVRTMPQLPDASLFTEEPRVVCGMRIEFPEIDEAIEEYFEKQNVTNPEMQKYASHRWQIYNRPTNSWDDIGSTNEFNYSTGSTIVMRYIVTTECGTEIVSEMFSIEIEPRSTDNRIESLYLDVIVKYEGWLLILDKIGAERKIANYPDTVINAISLDDAVIQWYRQVGAEPASIKASGWPDGDELVPEPKDADAINRKFYRVNNQGGALPDGSYYAVLKAEIPQEIDPCSTLSIRTLTACVNCDNVTPSNAPSAEGQSNNIQAGSATDGQNSSAATWQYHKVPKLSPAVTHPGGTVTIYNLNPDVVTTLEVYDVLGERVETLTVTGQDTYNYLTSRSRYGCFLINVRSEDSQMALKYIVR